MKRQIGCRFDYAADHERPRSCRGTAPEDRVRSCGSLVDGADRQDDLVLDLYGKPCRRLTVAPGESHFSTTRRSRSIQRPSDAGLGRRAASDRRSAVDLLALAAPEPILPVRRAGAGSVGSSSARTAPGGTRVQAVCDWGQRKHRTASRDFPPRRWPRSTRGGADVPGLRAPRVTFCRALGIPARYVFGYMPEIASPAPIPDGLPRLVRGLVGTSWWTYDARFTHRHRARADRPRARCGRRLDVTSYGRRRRAHAGWADGWCPRRRTWELPVRMTRRRPDRHVRQHRPRRDRWSTVPARLLRHPPGLRYEYPGTITNCPAAHDSCRRTTTRSAPDHEQAPDIRRATWNSSDHTTRSANVIMDVNLRRSIAT